MKKLICFVIILVLLLCGCTGGAEKLSGQYEGYYLENDEGILSVTNYAPYGFLNLPHYQELAQYGDGAGIDNEGVVYFIFITDTSKEDTYYSAEFDGETRELLCEEGAFFADEKAKNEAVDRLLNMLDALKVDN